MHRQRKTGRVRRTDGKQQQHTHTETHTHTYTHKHTHIHTQRGKCGYYLCAWPKLIKHAQRHNMSLNSHHPNPLLLDGHRKSGSGSERKIDNSGIGIFMQTPPSV